MSADCSIFRKLDGTELAGVTTQAARIVEAANAIDACSILLRAFISDDETNDTIPSEIKNNYVRSGLIDAILIAANRLAHVGEYFEEHLRIAEQEGKP